MTIIFVNDFFCKSSLIKVQIHRFKPKVYWWDSNYFSDLSQKVGFSLLWAKSWIFTDMSQKVGFSLIWAKKLNFHFYEPKVEFSLIWAKKFNFHSFEPKNWIFTDMSQKSCRTSVFLWNWAETSAFFAHHLA